MPADIAERYTLPIEIAVVFEVVSVISRLVHNADMEDMSDVTRLLYAIKGGDPQAAEDLLPLVYEELRKLAAARMARAASGHTLQPTALVHEAWLRLAGGEPQSWDSRAHFFGAAAEAMRRILIENARRKQARCRGGGQQRLDIDELNLAAPAKDEELLSLNEVLEKFAAHDRQKAELVKLRYFVGLTLEEAAELLNISTPMAKRWWTYARAWLYREMDKLRN